MPDDTKAPLPFSQRMRIVPVRTALQVDSMDDALRNSLWNILTEKVFDPYKRSYEVRNHPIVTRIWRDHLRWRIDDMDQYRYSFEAIPDIRKHFLACPWHGVYDFIEFVAKQDNASFCPVFNLILEREHAGYRFVHGILSPIVSEAEIASQSKSPRHTQIDLSQ